MPDLLSRSQQQLAFGEIIDIAIMLMALKQPTNHGAPSSCVSPAPHFARPSIHMYITPMTPCRHVNAWLVSVLDP